MFGFGKKPISAMEFGQGIVQLASEAMSLDCSRALGMRFENWDGSKGWSNFLLSRGIPIETQKLHFRLWTHVAIQTFCTRFDGAKRHTIIEGAMRVISGVIPGYDMSTTYRALEDAFQGHYQFDDRVARLTNLEGGISYLPNPQAHATAAKYLIQEFALRHMPNAQAFIGDFSSYTGTVGASIGTVSRAVDHIEKSFKVA
ncbi:hypothetical protein [Tardiphaga sp. OK245]|jgi:hypothetical protein|uniref:hypothetical protein n=1 Tax=Tardiphaga sp. OK245 TaxID=1855306 RepID=UPI0008A78073|nr:hypothetical protein [Tardiphaga sp. OK245]SEI24357.1 hypothetical protein SAMN05216367_5990 [Tardiphaga sp. OK245]